MTKSLLIHLILAVFLLGCSTSNHEFEGKNSEQEIIEQLEKVIAESLPKDRSISGAIVKESKVIWSKAYGVSNPVYHSLADTGTIYRIGSISKPFTAFLMMLLVQDSVIHLNDPVELYLPEIKKLKGYSDHKKITFQQLATHTSGLIREPDLTNAASGPIHSLLEHDKLSIRLVSERTGYNSTSSFSTQFKLYYGFTPGKAGGNSCPYLNKTVS